MELINEIDNHLSQYPYISYTSNTNTQDKIILRFSKSLDIDYIKGILDPFNIEIMDKKELIIAVLSKKPKMVATVNNKPIIQNIEIIDIPTLYLTGIEAKVDSGANSSSIDVSRLMINRNTKKVKFIPLSKGDKGYTGREVICDLHSEISVQSSNGSSESRPMIIVDIKVRDKIYETFISLTERDQMDYKILLGKDLLSNFLINPGI